MKPRKIEVAKAGSDSAQQIEAKTAH